MIERNKRLAIGTWMMCSLFFGSCVNAIGEQQPVAFTTVDVGSGLATPDKPVTNPSVFILRSSTEWTDQFKALPLTVQPDMPLISFDDNVFIVVVDGFQSTSGHSITITGVQSSPTGVIVEAVEESPAINCSVQPWDNQPFHIISIPNLSGSATLNLTHKETFCGPL